MEWHQDFGLPGHDQGADLRLVFLLGMRLRREWNLSGYTRDISQPEKDKRRGALGSLTLTLRSRHSSQAPNLRINAALCFVASRKGPRRPDRGFLGRGWSPPTLMSFMARVTDCVALAHEGDGDVAVAMEGEGGCRKPSRPLCCRRSSKFGFSSSRRILLYSS